MSDNLFGCILLIIFFAMAAALICVSVKPPPGIQNRIVKTLDIDI